MLLEIENIKDSLKLKISIVINIIYNRKCSGYFENYNLNISYA